MEPKVKSLPSSHGSPGMMKLAGWLAWLAGGLAWVSPLTQAWSAQPIIPEFQVSTAKIVDFEFDWGRDGIYCPTCNYGDGNSRFIWSDRDYSLWLGYVDYYTGNFYPENGKGVLIDNRASFSTDWGNGPEWMFSTGPSQIVYTRYADGVRPSALSAGVAVATQRSDQNWRGHHIFKAMQRQSPAATLDLDDPAPRINYQDARKSKLYWRTANAPRTEELLPISEQTGGGSRRWVAGTRKIIYSGTAASGSGQVFLYDTDSGELEQLTFDETRKIGAFMWRAPEFNNEYVFYTMTDRTSISVYRKLRNSEGVLAWTEIKTVQMPQQIPYIWSPEPFVHNGKSWIFFTLSSSQYANDLSVPTQIAMTGIVPGEESFRMLTNDNTKYRVRLDPEHFITAQGPYIYYNRYIPKTDTNPLVAEGVWRVDTRLGPPAAMAPVTRAEATPITFEE